MTFRYSPFFRIKGFFVDAGVILSYRTAEKKDLVSFIDNTRYRFLFTETTKDILERTGELYSMPKRFLYIESDLHEERKKAATDYLAKKYKNMTPELRETLLVLLEAEQSRHDIGAIDADELLAGDVDLYKKSIEERILERAFKHAQLKYSMNLRSIDNIVRDWSRYRK
jgi:hypothetical protein